VPECARTAINTATVALQDFPNHRVRGDFGEKPTLIEVVWFAVYSDGDFSPPSNNCSI
jgi:hypothetical protein